ncbi:hypothetical protein LXM50_01635 [Microbacterium sp. Au-Mic1]|uniref:phage major capsid protein n=1 Tax=Microbacterium sp. Au-Mic1 TaxID=2906457 RepID=UPI001E29C4BC|nr:hypothetical protein [Microbacterium sp. Au-Mic1]MCE4024668.1 hypothetical protein [Microbacterium sp. Au-Mic1]
MSEELAPSDSLIENDSASHLESYGDFTYDPEARTLRGLLVPFGEPSRTNSTGQTGVVFTADTINIPRDVSVVTLNREHDRYDPVGRATELKKTERGVEATFQLADTDEADSWLSRQKDKLRKLSAEVRFAADGLSARISGAALVTEGAFASAGLFALAPDAEEDPETPEAEEAEDKTPDAAPAQENPTNEMEEDTVSSIVPDAPGAVSPAANDNEAALFAAIANRQSNPEALAPFANAGAAFAVQNLQASGPSTVTIEADVTVPQAVRELWQRRPYRSRYTPLINSGTLLSPTVTGWKWDATKEPTVGDYAGNLAEVPTSALDTIPVTAQAAIIAGGNKIDRKYYDFGNTEVIASYMRLQTEDVARKLDAKVLSTITGAATVTAPGTVPAGVPKGLAAIVDGALGVINTDNAPSFAIVSPELWRDIVMMADKDKLAYLNAGFGLEAGDVESFSIQPGNVGTGKVIVGAKEAATFYTLGGGAPIRVEGLAVHNGGVDVAVFAYWAAIVNNAAAIRSVTVV